MKSNRAENSQGFTRTNSQKSLGGFTIIELLLATVVFSVVLTITVGVFLGVGRLFFKGVSGTSTNETAKQVLDDIADSIRSAPSLSDRQESYGYRYFCIGNSRYSFALGGSQAPDGENIPIAYNASKEPNYDPASKNANLGLLKDKLFGSSACASPCPPTFCGSGAVPFNNPKELLGDKMRLVDLAINSSSGTTNLFIVTMTVAYGNRETLNFDISDLDHIKAQCSGSLASQEFCSVTTLSTGVYRGIHP